MRGKWTLGPWRARIDRNGRHEVLGAGLHQVAAVFHTPDGLGAANADLIAAAPALYEALERACEIIADLSRFANNNGAMIDDETFAEGLAALSLAHPPANHTEESKP